MNTEELQLLVDSDTAQVDKEWYEREHEWNEKEHESDKHFLSPFTIFRMVEVPGSMKNATTSLELVVARAFQQRYAGSGLMAEDHMLKYLKYHSL